jgi:hypothetical protein
MSIYVFMQSVSAAFVSHHVEFDTLIWANAEPNSHFNQNQFVNPIALAAIGANISR